MQANIFPVFVKIINKNWNIQQLLKSLKYLAPIDKIVGILKVICDIETSVTSVTCPKPFSRHRRWESHFLPWQPVWADFRHPAPSPWQTLEDNMISRPISPSFWKYVNLLQIWVDQILILKSHWELECLGARKGDKARYHLLEDKIIHFHQLVSLSYLLPSKFIVSLSSYLPKSGKIGGVHFWGQTNWRKISQKSA